MKQRKRITPAEAVEGLERGRTIWCTIAGQCSEMFRVPTIPLETGKSVTVVERATRHGAVWEEATLSPGWENVYPLIEAEVEDSEADVAMLKTYGGECEMEPDGDIDHADHRKSEMAADVRLEYESTTYMSISLPPGKWKVTAERVP